MGGDGKVLAAARVNLSEYIASREFVNLRSQLKNSVPDAPPLVIKFRLRSALVRVTPARMPSLTSPKPAASAAAPAAAASPATPMDLGALSRRTAVPVPETPTTVTAAPMPTPSSVNTSTMNATMSTPPSAGTRSALNSSMQEKHDDLRLDNERLKAALEAQGAELQQLGEEHEDAQADVARLKGKWCCCLVVVFVF